jgi:quercetin 2,3-dioxygenase
MDRSVAQIINASRTFEGEGFPVRRPFPTRALMDFDPFLLLDEMGPADHKPGEAKGAPDHPHRGFETVTYMLEGGMVHKDSAGNSGKIGPVDVQWMTAGAGVVHSELPAPQVLEKGGRQHGFQLWVNLPARDKMMAPRYQEIPSARIPEAVSPDGKTRVRVVAGEAYGVRAAIETRTPVMYFHYRLAPGAAAEQAVPRDYNAFAYVFRGGAVFGGRSALEAQLAVFGNDGDRVAFTAGPKGAELLLLAGVPLNEPVARYGPFVMNTEDQIRQAFEDFRSGRMGRIA